MAIDIGVDTELLEAGCESLHNRLLQAKGLIQKRRWEQKRAPGLFVEILGAHQESLSRPYLVRYERSLS